MKKSSPDCVRILEPHCDSLLSVLAPPARIEVARPPKSCGRVLTSVENLKAMEEKERAKKDKIKQQEERKRRMEQRRKEKVEQAEEKRKNSEAKKQKQMSNPTPRKAQRSQKAAQLSFTVDEVKWFERRFENGYDLKNDERYNAWLKTRTTESEPLCKAGT